MSFWADADEAVVVDPEPQTASQLKANIAAPRDDAAGVHSLALQTQDVVMSNPHSTSHVVEGHGVATVATVGADNVVSHSETAAQLESKPVLLANSAQLSAVDPLVRLPMDEVKRVARGLRLLNLCGGPVRPKDGLDLYVEEWGGEDSHVGHCALTRARFVGRRPLVQHSRRAL